MKLFITGAQSFIGTALRLKCKAIGVEASGMDAAPPGVTGCLQGDIRDPEIAEVIPAHTDAVVHLAAVSRDNECRANPLLAFDVNVQGTLNLITAARKLDIKQFIFASSEWVYGNVISGEAQIEDQLINIAGLRSVYALTKIVGEQCLRLAQEQGLPGATVLRFSIVYGPRSGNWSAVETLFHAVRTRECVEVGSLKTARRFVHVADIVEGILASVGRTGFEIFNLAGNESISLGNVIDVSSRLLGRRPRIIEREPSNASIRNPDNSRACRVLNWRPKVSLESGLESVFEFFKAEKSAAL